MSGINTIVNRVHIEPVQYVETDPFLIREREHLTGTIFDPVHPQLQVLHTLRDQHRADIVTLLVHQPPTVGQNPTYFCGKAKLLEDTANPQFDLVANDGTGMFASAGFNVVRINCAVKGESLSHEVGHNFGAQHDRYVLTNADGAVVANKIPGAFGFVLVPHRVRTIMAYNNFCKDILGVGCARIPYFSNKDQTYMGFPLGVPDGFPYFSLVDNRLAMNLTARTVANFRHASFPLNPSP